jgi:type I restriction-modification system DNA methylase subunit
MYVITKCSKKSIILDPTCGSGTFLTNAMANMWSESFSEEEQNNISLNQLFGIESNTFNATLAGINMMLHGDGASHIFNADCFIKLPDLNNCYDRVLMNPPFSQTDNELKFVFDALYHMANGGYLSAIVPKSCVKGTEQKNINYLKQIFEISDLLNVVSLPNDLFQPNAGVSTCIITLKKTNKKHCSKTLLVNLSEDGYELTKNSGRLDNGSWERHFGEIVKIFNKFYEANNKDDIELEDKKAVIQTLNYNDELLFEGYSSYRPLAVGKETFARYIREYISAKVLCGMDIKETKINAKNTIEPIQQKKFKISDLIFGIAKGKIKSIDRKLEDKFNLFGTPLIIAKKDNNGIGGMKQVNTCDVYKNKFCIIIGGDGGGGKTYYCDYEFCATNFVLICDLKAEYQPSADKYARFYLAIVISERLHKTINHGRTIKEVPSNIDIELPVNEFGDVNFPYMSDYIQSLQYAKLI